MSVVKWHAETAAVPNGVRIQLFAGDEPLSFENYLALLNGDDAFAGWYTSLLTGSEFGAVFWEHPPLTSANLHSDAEFVLVDAPGLARCNPDPAAFRSHFAGRGKDEVIAFPNLGGDAMMVVPCPASPAVSAHLLSFLREGPQAQVRELWRVTAKAVCARLGEAPLWLSTSGLGVSWLHLRLDSVPKYYQHRPYRVRQD